MSTSSQLSSVNPVHKFARLSLLSIIITTVFIIIHHLYKLGPSAFILGFVLAGSGVMLLRWFKNTKGITPLILYGLLNVWIIVGFGLSDGLWDSTIKVFFSNFLFPDSRLFIRSPLRSYLFEVSGVLTFVGSMYVLYYGYKFLSAVFVFKQWKILNQRLKLMYATLFIIMVLLGSYKSLEKTIIIPRDKVVKIGITIPMEGQGKLLGMSFLKAVKLAEEDIKKTKYKYELVIENSGTTPTETDKAIQKLIEKDHVQAIVGGISASGRIIKPYATSAKIPHLCVCSIKTIGDGEYNFTNIPLAEDEAIAWVKEAKKQGIKRVAILNQKYPSIEGHVAALKEQSKKEHIEIVYEKEFEESTKDFSSLIEKAKSKRPDIYFISAFSPALDLLGEQLKTKGIKNIASIVALSVSNSPGLFEGNWYTDSYVDSAFKARFEQKYPGVRFATHMMPYAYDSFNMMVQAFESEEDPAKYLQKITEYPGTSGPLTKKAGEGNFRSTPVVWVIKDGRPQLRYEK
jgi:branched-chain amino acid transport system substrate-binding protein